jgi:hypothetical protein
VVQIFRVEVQLSKAKQVIFVPLDLPDFNDDTIIRRFSSALARAALSSTIRDSLFKIDTVEFQPEPKTSFSVFNRPLGDFFKEALSVRSSLVAGAVSLGTKLAAQTVATPPKTTDGDKTDRDKKPSAAATSESSGDNTPASTSSQSTPPAVVSPSDVALPKRLDTSIIPFQTALPVLMQTNNYLWDQQHLSRLSSLFRQSIQSHTTTAISLPSDVNIEGAIVEGTGSVPLKAVFRTATGQEVTDFGPGTGMPLISVRDLTSIAIRGSNPNSDYPNVSVSLTLNRGGVITPITLPSVVVPKGSPSTVVVNIRAGGASADVKSHLMANRMYYAQVIFRSLDATDIALMLSGYGYPIAGKMVPITQLIDPRPVRYVGNYLAFTTNVQSRKGTEKDPDPDPNWTKFLQDAAIVVGETTSEVVPLGTGGVFAEAILGRANCAEKLDVTRFWNWQESPTPLQPTDIAAIQTGSRATQENLAPGQLSNPLIAQQTPSSLPDPVGTAALLTAIQNGNMFRDQSGLAATIGLTQAALQATQQGAATAGMQASQNLQAQLQATTERQKTAAQMVTDLARTAAAVYTGNAGMLGGSSGGGGGGGGGGQSSKKGEMINYFDKTKGDSGAGEAGSSSGGGSSGSSGGSSGSGSGSSGSGGLLTPGGGSSSADGSDSGSALGFSQNPAARAAVGSDGGLLSGLISKVGDVIGMGDDSATTSASALLSRKAWPHLDPDKVLGRIKDLGGAAYKFDQGKFGLCLPAAFYYIVITNHADGFVSFANALYGGGIGFLGNLKVDPDADLRYADYAAIQGRVGPQMPPQADWMLMCSIRDSENWFIDFEGDVTEETAAETYLSEINEWFNKTGWYTAVFKLDPSLADLKALNADGSNVMVVLLFKVKMLVGDFEWTKGMDDHHGIVVRSKFNIDETVKRVSFNYWTWASPPRDTEMSLDTFKDNVIAYSVVTKL